VVEIVTTVASAADADRIARTLVTERLAACAAIDACRSLFRWRGELQDEPEHEIRLKTLAIVAPAAEARLREIHPYETPAILRLPVLAANDDYVAWVAENVGKP